MNKLKRAIWLLVLLAGASGAASAACTVQPINFNETKSGIIASDDCVNESTPPNKYYYDAYRFSATAGQQIAILHSSTAYDPYLFLVLPDNTFLFDDNSGGGLNARIPASGFLTLTQTGTYEIQAVTALSMRTGAYTLTLSAPPAPAGCTVVAAPASSSTSSLAPGTSVTLTANCASGQQPITYSWTGTTFTGSVRTVAPTTTTLYSMIASNAGGSAPAVNITVFVDVPPPPGTPTVEFYNTTLKHYFVTASQAEAAGIDNGAAGPGWVRTGYSYDVQGFPVNAQSAQAKAFFTNPVCRFYGTPGVGPNSHFYTVDDAECTAVKRDPGWFYEGIAYHVQPPVAGNCPAGTQPIFRLYNDRAKFNDSNHRFVTNLSTFQQMGERGWSMEGLVMCTTAVRSPTGVTGGTFKVPSGAGVTVTPGQIPPYVNATQPATTPSPRVPAGMEIDPAQGDVNVTAGAPAYDFNLTGDGGFSTTDAGAVTITMPFDASAIPVADRADPIKIFTRLFNSDDNSQVDLAGDISLTGTSGMLTMETRGLPPQFTASVVYNPNMEAITSEEAPPSDFEDYLAPSMLKVTATTWPAQGWCVIYNSSNADLIAAVKNLRGLAGNPTLAQIRADVVSLVGGNARKSQTIYQAAGMNAPNLYLGRTCRDRALRYNVHVISRPKGSVFVSNDPGEAISSGTDHFGRLYIDAPRLDDSINAPLGTVLASVAHEMLHAIQSGYQVCCGDTPKGYREGSAATYGKSIDNGQVIKVRNENQSLGESLMNTAHSYSNEDFFAYVGKQYNGGNLNYLSGLYAQIRSSIGAKVYNPSATTLYSAMDASFKASFNQSLQAIYLDFVKQRALTHNAASQFGRPGEVVSGFAEGVFGPGGVYKQNVDISTCRRNTISLRWNGLPAFATAAIEISPTGVLPAGTTDPTLQVKIKPTTSAIGLLWGGHISRAGATLALAETNKFANFGRAAGDRVFILVSNMNPVGAGTFDFEINCVGVVIDSTSPVKGPTGTSVTIIGSGFGSATDTRSVTFNGVTATATFSSDTRAVATVPSNASTGDVIVTVNGDKSNGVNFEVVAVCSATQNAGGDTPDTRTIELGKPAGTFVFNYETFTQKDRMLVFYQGITLFDTGCVGANGSKPLNYNGTSTQISVQVIPNCAGGTGTSWNYSVSCP